MVDVCNSSQMILFSLPFDVQVEVYGEDWEACDVHSCLKVLIGADFRCLQLIKHINCDSLDWYSEDVQELPVEIGLRKQARLSSDPIEVVQLMLLQSVDDLINVVLDPLEIALNLHPLPHVYQLPPLLLVVVGCIHHEDILVLVLLLVRV